MPTYRITFTGRQLGAIGIFSPFVERVEATTPEEALAKLYDKYEHISGWEIEIEPVRCAGCGLSRADIEEPHTGDLCGCAFLLEDWEEYDSVADWCAQRGHKGKPGDPLPENLSTSVASLIDADPEAFEARVREHAYARAMNALNLPEE